MKFEIEMIGVQILGLVITIDWYTTKKEVEHLRAENDSLRADIQKLRDEVDKIERASEGNKE